MAAAKKRKSYDNVMPTLPSIMKYVELCDVWRSTSWLAQETGISADAVAKMCKRLYRNGILDSTQRHKGMENEFIASAIGRRIYDDVLDGRIEVDVSPGELGSCKYSGPKVESYLREQCLMGRADERGDDAVHHLPEELEAGEG